ncbi:uncharacterized protein LOC100211598 isoform X2 [Hydra vulgaris]|uniref:Uncharacterized protein LOC100211598 isoform X2 n=1 Tax=Hydra vulgaris TaxID=6087 RepID=A0ABM4C8H8_HYDVU
MGNSQSQTKEEKLAAEIAAKETLVECPILVDFGHGTIRHRHIEASLALQSEESHNKKVKLGYFYHPRLSDFSEDASYTGSETNRLKYVFKGPSKDKDQHLYYIYGTKISDKDYSFINNGYKPKGIGFDWPETYRHANHSYYDAKFTNEENESLFPLNVKDDSIFDEEIVDFQKDVILMRVLTTENVGGVIEKISLHKLIPSAMIHIMVANKELKLTEPIIDFIEWTDKPPLYAQIRLSLT